MAETCPKCGYGQVETDECPRCRVVVSRYRLYLSKLGQKPAAPSAPTAAPPTAARAAVAVESGEWVEGNPGGFWIRAAALSVDSTVLGALMLPFQMFIVFPTLLVGGFSRTDPSAMFAAVNAAYNVVYFLVFVIYYVWMHGRYGQTLGKIATGVRVVRADDQPIGYGRAFGRLLATLLNFITFGIGYLVAAFRADRRGLHDLVGGTRVMKVRRPWLEGKPSGFWMRYLALQIDWQVLVFPLLAIVGMMAAVLIPAAASGGRVAGELIAAVILTGVLFMVALSIVYSVWMHGKWGQTLGKMALGMRVVRVDGSPLGYGGAFLRWIGGFISGLIFMIGYIMAGLRSDKRALHDLIAGSRVTYIR